MTSFISPFLSSLGLSRKGPGLRSVTALRGQRRNLAKLSPEALEDMGISREDAMAEAQRPAWDVPHHWRR